LKKFCIFLLVVFIGAGQVFAQGGNLQFNQVIKMTAASGQLTVPAPIKTTKRIMQNFFIARV
jgi:hypothetical protein